MSTQLFSLLCSGYHLTSPSTIKICTSHPMSNVTVNNEDGSFVSKKGQGDLMSLGNMYDQYSSILNGIIMRIVKDEALAEKVLAKVFLNARSQAVTNETTSFFCSLFKSSRQLSFDAIKGQELKNLAHHNGVYEITTTAFELLYYKGLNYNEAAIALNKTVEEVKTEVRGTIFNLKKK